MRRLVLALITAAALSAPALADPLGDAASPLAVPIDQSARITLRGAAMDVVVGNPAIADVSLLDSRNLVVIGKGYGVTNLLVVDQRGRTILDQQIVVSAADSGRISFYRGPRVDNYSCSPRCERTPMPGEPDDQYTKYASPSTSYAGRARESQGPAAANP